MKKRATPKNPKHRKEYLQVWARRLNTFDGDDCFWVLTRDYPDARDGQYVYIPVLSEVPKLNEGPKP